MNSAMVAALSAVKGLVFDKDGTLIDLTATWLAPMRACAGLVASAAGDTDLTEQLLIDGGYRPATHDWAKDSVIAYGDEPQLLDLWAKRAGKAAVVSVRDQFFPITAKAVNEAVPMVDDLAALIQTLSNDFTLGVASMDTAANIETTLTSLGLRQYFSYLCGADSGEGIKPSGGMTRAFGRAMGLEPSEVAVIGDSLHDVRMGLDAGAITIAVMSGGHDRTELEQFAHIVIDDVSQLPQLLLDQVAKPYKTL